MSGMVDVQDALEVSTCIEVAADSIVNSVVVIDSKSCDHSNEH
jgi:hypothetical protein